MARDYDVSALGLALWQGLPLDSAGMWKVSLAYDISSQSCKNMQTVRTSRCYFFWPVLINGKSTRKTANFWEKHAKNC